MYLLIFISHLPIAARVLCKNASLCLLGYVVFVATLRLGCRFSRGFVNVRLVYENMCFR